LDTHSFGATIGHPLIRGDIILLEGRNDYIVSATVAAEWFERVEAPSKKFVWFEHTAHAPMIEAPGRTLVALLNTRDRSPNAPGMLRRRVLRSCDVASIGHPLNRWVSNADPRGSVIPARDRSVRNSWDWTAGIGHPSSPVRDLLGVQ